MEITEYSDMSTASSLPLSQKAIYASGNLGAVLGDTVIATFLLYFYFPPECRGPAWMPAMVGALIPTWLLLNLIARAVDGIADPLVALWSDRSTHRLGRRRVFMLVGALPLAFATASLFHPPAAPGSPWNAVYLGVCMCLYFFLFTVYVAPYLALLPEIGQSEKERLDLSTFMAIAALVGAGLAMVAGPALFLPSEGESVVDVQNMVWVLSVISGLAMLLPAMWIKEPRANQAMEATSAGLFESIRATLSDPAFRYYLLGTILFWFGFNIVRGATPFYVTVLMGESLAFQSLALGAVFAMAGLCFPLVNGLAKRFGKATVMMWGSAVLAVALFLVPLIRGKSTGLAVLALSGIGVGVLLSVPNAILAEICQRNAERTGQRREAMFFGAQGFFLKLNLGVSSGVLALLFTLLGNGSDHPGGVRFSGPLGAVVLGLSIWAFARLRKLRY